MNNNNNNKDKPFFCYSKKLKDELSARGIRYTFRGIHERTHIPFWMYMPSEELSNYLDQRRTQYK